MSGTRLQSRETPVGRRIPIWSMSHYYAEGTMVCKSIDSDDIIVFVCLESHISNDSEGALYLDSEINSKWLFHSSSKPLDSDSLDSKQRAIMISDQMDSDKPELDSDLANLIYVASQAGINYDSDIAVIDSDFGILFGKNVYTLEDKKTAHRSIIVWDSDSEKYKSVLPIWTLNTSPPDLSGNFLLSLTKTSKGTGDDIPDSDNEGAFFIIQNDSDSEVNGLTYIYDGTQWVLFKDARVAANELIYLKSDGSNEFDGRLFSISQPVDDSDIVTKLYVDFWSSYRKQNRFDIFDSEGLVDTSVYDSETFVLLTANTPKITFFDGTALQTVEGLDNDFDDLGFVEVLEDSDGIGNGVFILELANFDSYVPNTITLKKNNVNTNFVLDSDGNALIDSNVAVGVKVFRLLNSSLQRINIKLTAPIDVSADYSIECVTHYGTTILASKTLPSDWQIKAEDMDYGFF